MEKKAVIQNISTQPIKWDVGPEYTFVRELGNGSYGSVCEATKTGTAATFAIKKYTGIFRNITLCRRVLREIELLYMLNHTHIVKPTDIFTRNGVNDVYLVMEVAQADLRRLGKAGITLDEQQIKIILYSLLTAVNYLHSGGIVHRDIKPGNILVNSDCTIWLCDFSISRSITGLKSSAYDCDQALRQNPYFGSSGSSFLSFGEASSHSFSTPLGGSSKNEDMDEIDEEPPAQSTFHCDFQVKKKKKSDDASNSKIDSDCSKAETVKKKSLTEEEKVKRVEAKKNEQRGILLGKCKQAAMTFERELTGHIGTRYYRAPELVLLEKVYTTSIDMWGIGCVFAELLGMVKPPSHLEGKRDPIFPGSSCFPVSPSLKPTAYIAGLPISPRDQMNMIIKVLGNPSESDISFLSDKKAEEYVKGLPKQKRKDFGSLYPEANSDALDLLQKLLTFNPYYRITAKEALRHKFFADVRERSLEIELAQAIELTTEKYSNEEFAKMCCPILMNLIGMK